MPDVSLMIQSGYTPKKEWIERHFRVELEDKKENQDQGQEGGETTFDPEQDKDLFGSIFGDQAQSGTPPTANQEAAAADMQAAAQEVTPPPGAVPEEAQTEAIPTEVAPPVEPTSPPGETEEAPKEKELSSEEILRMIGIEVGGLESEVSGNLEDELSEDEVFKLIGLGIDEEPGKKG
jgi:hypothetical protein